MDKTVRTLWVRALKSGKYPQSAGHLRDRYGYCCLGVLCEIAAAKGVIPAPEQSARSQVWAYGADSETGVLPAEVIAWAGLDSDDPSVDGKPLTYLNDVIAGSFTVIASYIRAHL